MKFLIAALFIALLPLSASAGEAPSAAEKAGEAWLMLVDTKQYSESWLTASFEFQKGIGQANWGDAVGPVRDRLGKVVSRKIGSVKKTTSMPGLPDGEYTTIEYQTIFANKANAKETITLISDNGVPKVGGYFIN